MCSLKLSVIDCDSALTSRSLENVFRPVLQNRFHFSGKLIPQRAVDQPVIECQGEETLRAYPDGVVDHNRNLLDSADAQNRDLRLIDDRRGEDAAEGAEIGDGECAALNFIGLQLARAGSRGQVDDG